MQIKMGVFVYYTGLLWFRPCLAFLSFLPQWRNCISWLECVQFVLSVQYCFANSLLFLGKVDAALSHMGPLRRSHCPFVFPPAQFGCAQLFLRLRRQAVCNCSIDMIVCTRTGEMTENLSSLNWLSNLASICAVCMYFLKRLYVC